MGLGAYSYPGAQTADFLTWDASPWAETIAWLAEVHGEVHLADLKMPRQAEERLAELQEIAHERGARNA